MLIKILVVLGLIVIIYCLASALYFLAREGGKGKQRVAKALSWRIILSICLFLFLLVAYFFGWITPHGVIPT